MKVLCRNFNDVVSTPNFKVGAKAWCQRKTVPRPILRPRCFRRLFGLTVYPRSEMQRFKENKSYNYSNCFGFNESDADLSLWEKSSVMNDTNAVLEFQTNKPYRLALYVRPSEQKRLHKTKASLLVKNTVEKQMKGKKAENVNNTQISEKKEPKRSTRTNKKVNVSLFDENVKPENVSKRIKKTPEKDKPEKSVTIEVPSARKNVLKEVNTKSLPKTRQNKVRRSYERKFKEKDETENVAEPPSEEIIKELEFKKLTRTKQKKTAKEEQEFEKWANSMNCAFDDVDKFELSIAYD